MFDVLTPTPVCAGFSVSFGIKAFDPDANELVTLDIYDNTGILSVTCSVTAFACGYCVASPVANMSVTHFLHNLPSRTHQVTASTFLTTHTMLKRSGISLAQPKLPSLKFCIRWITPKECSVIL